MRNFDNVINKLKKKLNVHKDKDIYELFNVSNSNFSNWRKRNKIPYEKIITLCEKNNITYSDIFMEDDTKEIIQIAKDKISKFQEEIKNDLSTNKINIQNNSGQIHINSSNELENEICNAIKKLSNKRKEYYYHRMKADILEEEL